MRTQSWILLFLMTSGCVFTDLQEIPRQIGVVPGEDAGVDLASDVAVPGPDSGIDMSSPDMDPAPNCGEPRAGIPSALKTCPNQDPAVGNCDIVLQTNCATGKYCSFVFGGSRVAANCADIPQNCGFLRFGEVCFERQNGSPVGLGVCEPGGFCPSLRMAQTQSLCERYCELESGLGCKIDELCAVIMSTKDGVDVVSDQSNAGYGVCQAETECKILPI